MVPVCVDTELNGNRSMWFYADGRYTRHDEAGAIQGRITGQNLPNPQALWKARCEANGGIYPCESVPHPQTGQSIRLKPTEATFKLFEHWQGMQANALINN